MQEKPITKKIIYQADDDQDDRMLFLDAVLDLNLPVAVLQAADGQELLDALLKSKCLPEFIFLDISMPCKDGFHCLTEIRNAEGDLKNVNIIMLSISSSPANIELSYELGADFYAVKPSSFQGLKDILQHILNEDSNKKRKNKKDFLLI